MPQGVICISPITAFKDTFDLTIDPALIDLGKLKDALLLPDRYAVERVHKPIYGPYRDCAEIIVSSPDIPETQGETLPNVTPCYTCEGHEDGKTRTLFLSDILINGVSAIREEDKGHKVTIEIKEVKDLSANVARDTQFSGVAKLLWGEIGKLTDDFCNECSVGTGFHGVARDMERADTFEQDIERLISRRFYDLLKHAFYELDIWCDGSLDTAVQCIPDLNKWPDESEYPRTNQ